MEKLQKLLMNTISNINANKELKERRQEMNDVFFNNFIYDNDYYTHLINYDCQTYVTRNR